MSSIYRSPEERARIDAAITRALGDPDGPIPPPVVPTLPAGEFGGREAQKDAEHERDQLRDLVKRSCEPFWEWAQRKLGGEWAGYPYHEGVIAEFEAMERALAAARAEQERSAGDRERLLEVIAVRDAFDALPVSLVERHGSDGVRFTFSGSVNDYATRDEARSAAVAYYGLTPSPALLTAMRAALATPPSEPEVRS